MKRECFRDRGCGWRGAVVATWTPALDQPPAVPRDLSASVVALQLREATLSSWSSLLADRRRTHAVARLRAACVRTQFMLVQRQPLSPACLGLHRAHGPAAAAACSVTRPGGGLHSPQSTRRHPLSVTADHRALLRWLNPGLPATCDRLQCRCCRRHAAPSMQVQVSSCPVTCAAAAARCMRRSASTRTAGGDWW